MHCVLSYHPKNFFNILYTYISKYFEKLRKITKNCKKITNQKNKNKCGIR